MQDDQSDGAAAPPGVAAPFPYSGPPALQGPVVAALSRVIDPEVALTIVDLGLIYGVTLDPGRAQSELRNRDAGNRRHHECPEVDRLGQLVWKGNQACECFL